MSVAPPEKHREPRLTIEMLTQAQSSLMELDWRLLRWLLRYPLQRAEDLVVGVARWASRATVYRHLQVLEASGLVESVLPKALGEGKRLYHLSNLGLHVLARRLERSADELARAWQADDAGLLRRLSRLATLLPIQDVVNGLVIGAAEAMTSQGQRPQLVRWTWQRDVTQRFQYREQVMRLFVDGVMALCIRTRQKDGSSSLDHWYGLLLLYTNLDDERLMRLRLEHLLCWRESSERWPVYRYMLPVLILARSRRQWEHWLRAVEATSLKLRVEPPGGALSTLPLFEHAIGNPWLLNWHTLAGEESCHLQSLLKPLPLSAFPSTLTLLEEASGDEDERHASSASARTSMSPAALPPTRLRRLIVGNLTRRAVSLQQDQLEERELTALLGLRLTRSQWEMLYLLLDHPLLSDQDLAAFLALQLGSVRAALYTLHRLSCLDVMPTETGTRWYLGERGLRLIAAANRFHMCNLAVVAGDGTDPGTATTIKQKGVDWLMQHVQHTAGIYAFFAALTEAARQVPEHALCWWETGARCERRYQVGEQWYNLRPDALVEYRAGQRRFRFWLEWDRGTMNARDLVVKFASYAHYISSREWAKERAVLPRLLCVAPGMAQERRMQRVAQVGFTHVRGLEMWATTEELLNEHGPLAPIWSRSLPQQGSCQDTLLDIHSLLLRRLPASRITRRQCLETGPP